MRYSRRIAGAAERNELSRLLERKRAAGVPILDLTESNPTRAGIVYPGGYLDALSDSRAALYEPEPFGMPSAREAVARRYGVTADRVVLTASTSEAYSWLFKLLCNPGDEVLAPRPSYPLFEYLAALECAGVRTYSLFYDHGWFIDFHALKAGVTERTRAVIVVNPNNPTGHYARRHEVEELRSFCDAKGLALISDEVFSPYEIAPAEDSVRSLTGIADFVLNGLSKSAGLPQLKLAWMITRQPPDERLETIADTYLSVGAPVQCAAERLLAVGADVQRQINARVRRNLEHAPRCLRAEAGWYAVLPAMDEEAAALRLLEQEGVLVQPGYFYDFERSGYLVISLLTAPEVFDAGCAAIERLAMK